MSDARWRPLRTVLWGGAVVLALAAPLSLTSFWLQTGLFAMAAAIGAIGLTLLVGVTGQLSLGHAFFVAVGAFGYAFLAGPNSSRIAGAGLAPPLAAAGAVVLAGAAGALFSPIAGRLRGIYLGLASLALVFLGQHILHNATTITGGYNGRDVAPFELFGFSFTASNPDLTLFHVPYGALERLWYLGLVLVAVAYWYARNLIAGRPGRAMVSVRDSEIAAAVMGVDVRRYKAAAFTVSSAYAGLAGVLLALAFGRIVPDSFGFVMSIDFLAMIIIGGLGSLAGGVAGAVLVTTLPLLLSHYSDVIPFLATPGESGVGAAEAARLLYGAAVIAVLLYARGGLAQLLRPFPPLRSRPMNRRMLALATVLCLTLTACSKATSSDQNTGGLKTGPGVTATSIKLGSLVDLTAVFAPLSKSLVQGTQLFWKQQNAAGGVCGRTVEVVVKDHGYDPQKAVSAYREISSDVLGMQTVLGSPVLSALKPSIDQDNMFVGVAGWSASALNDERMQLLGTTYDVEAIAGLDFLIRTKGIQSGDKIVYFEGDFGENALKGSQYLATQKGLTIVGQKIKPSDTDLSAQVTAFRNAGVKAILVSAGPTQTASVAGVAKAQGLSVPIVANGPGFTPQLLGSPAGPALKENLTVVSSMAPPALDKPAVTELQTAFVKEYPGAVPTQVGSLFGYVQAKVTKDVLQKACDNKDLTRQGVLTAMHQLSGVDTGGLVAGTLDYTKPGAAPSRTVYISQVDASVPGGLKVVDGPLVAEPAKAYTPGM